MYKELEIIKTKATIDELAIHSFFFSHECELNYSIIIKQLESKIDHPPMYLLVRWVRRVTLVTLATLVTRVMREVRVTQVTQVTQVMQVTQVKLVKRVMAVSCCTCRISEMRPNKIKNIQLEGPPQIQFGNISSHQSEA
jgi:hypothetical protein